MDKRADGVGAVTACALAATLILIGLTGDAWRHPFQYGDDLLLRMGDPPARAYWIEKLEGEARWLVWGWGRFAPPFPASIDYVLSIAFWCGAMALYAWRIARGWAAAAATVALTLNPAALTQLYWLHTVAPAMLSLFIAAALTFAAAGRPALLAAAAAMGAWALMLSAQLLALLAIAGPLAIAVTDALRAEAPAARVLREGGLVLAGGAAGGLVGVLTGYTLNWVAFDRFGLAIAPWRTVGSEEAGLLARVFDSLADVAFWMAGEVGPVPFALAVIALAVLGLAAARGSAAAAAAVVALLGVFFSIALVTLVSDTPVPAIRGGVAMWFAMAAAPLLAGVAFRRERLATVAVVAIALCGAWSSPQRFAAAAPMALANANALDAIMRDVAATDDGAVRGVVAVGDAIPFQRIRDQGPWWPRNILAQALEDRFGLWGVVVCFGMAKCGEVDPAVLAAARALPRYPEPGYVTVLDDVMVLHFGDLE